ncbi:MAG TPA: hypothetical protein VK147_04680 [Candidatus Didemnitutus sp.]|nr:hypothetical protein [Candidatus Didemnitutus sp.]
MSTFKISPRHIIMDHWQTLRSYGKSKVSWVDVGMQYGAPLVIAGFWVYSTPTITSEFVATVLTVVSIMAALLLNLQVLLIGVVDKVADRYEALLNGTRGPAKNEVVGDRIEKARRVLLAQTNSNVSYAILVCLVLIIALLASYVKEPNRLIGSIGLFIIYFLIAHFIVSFFMILQRVHVSLKSQIARLLPSDE